MRPKDPGIAKKMIPKNPGIAQKGTQNNGTPPYRDICKLPPPPRASTAVKFSCLWMVISVLSYDEACMHTDEP